MADDNAFPQSIDCSLKIKVSSNRSTKLIEEEKTQPCVKEVKLLLKILKFRRFM